jgi:hypothetical protein
MRTDGDAAPIRRVYGGLLNDRRKGLVDPLNPFHTPILKPRLTKP